MPLSLATRPGIALLLSLICLGLGGVIYYELGLSEEKTPNAAAPVVAGAVPPLPPQPASSTLPPIETFAEVTRRPLFSATRQPPPETVKDTQGNSTSFALLGVIISESGKTALIEHGAPPAMIRLKEGQAVEGWTLQSILPDRVVLQRGATEQELKLKDRAAPPAQPPRQPPAVPLPRPNRG